MLAMQAGLRSSRISIVGSRHVMKKGELTTRPGRVTVIVHEPDRAPATPEPSVPDVRALADRVREIIRPPVEAEAKGEVRHESRIVLTVAIISAAATVSGQQPAEKWWSHVAFLASDAMKGRDTGTPEASQGG